MSRIKEILCMHHSHLDVGYTHPQNMILELQCDYIDQAIDLCKKTADWPEESRFCWTCEATYPVMKWLKSASAERVRLFRQFVGEGRISIAALPMHTTPGCTCLELTQYLQHLDEIRERTGSEIRTAISHDVDGQPWTLASLMLDSGIEFYLTGPNVHFGGIPFPRPYAFRWETPDGRLLPTFLGEHYSVFSQFFFTNQNSTELMHKGVKEYIERVEENGWNEDFIFLTATNPPLYDNNCPDIALADLIRKYNEERHEVKVRFATPEMLFDRIRKMGIETLDQQRGDWTDYWNFGCASTAREVKISRKAKALLQAGDFLSCFEEEEDPKENALAEEAYRNALLFDEHTWGWVASVTQPEHEMTCAQLNHKKEFAYVAADLSAYLVGRRMEKLTKNPFQSDWQEGVVLLNPVGMPMQCEVEISDNPLQTGRRFSASRAAEYLPYDDGKLRRPAGRCAMVEIPPFTAEFIPYSSLCTKRGKKGEIQVSGKESIDTPFYHVDLSEANGRISQITEKKTGRRLLAENAEWGFFDVVEEKVDQRFAAPERSAVYPKDIEKRNKSIPTWQHDWRAVREGIRKFEGFKLEEGEEEICLYYFSSSGSMKNIVQRIRFSAAHPRIELDISFYKEKVTEPEGIYLSFPLKLRKGWSCVYDTADTFVKLDEDQMGDACRDYITVDKSISLFDETGGYTLACPDAPMVQVGGFQFAKENRKIERNENPLLLAWPMNNYWDTNFAPSQEGMMCFHYELSCFEAFDAKESYRVGLQAAKPCIIGAAVECKTQRKKTMLQYDSETSAPIFLRPQYKGDGCLIAVKNFCPEEGSCEIRIPEKIIKSAYRTDIQGNEREELVVSKHSFSVVQRPGEIAFLNVQFM